MSDCVLSGTMFVINSLDNPKDIRSFGPMGTSDTEAVTHTQNEYEAVINQILLAGLKYPDPVKFPEYHRDTDAFVADLKEIEQTRLSRYFEVPEIVEDAERIAKELLRAFAPQKHTLINKVSLGLATLKDKAIKSDTRKIQDTSYLVLDKGIVQEIFETDITTVDLDYILMDIVVFMDSIMFLAHTLYQNGENSKSPINTTLN